MNRCGRWSGITAAVLAAFVLALGADGRIDSAADADRVALGSRLFRDSRFSTPNGDLPASCLHCHLYDEDPQGMRAHADFLARSWVPWRIRDPRRNELRNSPTLLDVALMPRLHFDGEFASLEDLVRGTLAGRPMGWLSEEAEQAVRHAYDIVKGDDGTEDGSGEPYTKAFLRAYDVRIEDSEPSTIMDLIARSISDFMRTLRSGRNTPYDRFIESNRLPDQPGPVELPETFANRLEANLSALESRGAVKWVEGFGRKELSGLRIFFSTGSSPSAGNCVACHPPPLFTDFSYHNIGISQAEYDRVHGDGSFSTLAIPSAGEAQRPSPVLRETPTRRDPRLADLGFWNFADPERSSLRRPGESANAFLERMIGAFKTPTLRNLGYTGPYMHTGEYLSIEEALLVKIRLARLARQGKLRSASPSFLAVQLLPEDIAAMVAFLSALDEPMRGRPTASRGLQRPGGAY